jgi:hypothetical protein
MTVRLALDPVTAAKVILTKARPIIGAVALSVKPTSLKSSRI